MIEPRGVAVRGEHYLSKNNQFNLVHNEGRSWTTKEIVLKALPNGLDSSRFGFVVSRRVGKAVVRNLVKRRLREITRQTPVKSGWDIIFIARIPAAKTEYNILDKSVGKLLARAGLLVGENEANRPGID